MTNKRFWWVVCGVVVFLGQGNLFGESTNIPRWWKGNLHTHSLWSDGDDFPEMIAEWYRNHGYHFISFSDHNVLSRGERWMSVEAVRARSKGEPWRGASFEPRDAFEDYLKRFGSNWVQTRNHPESGAKQVLLKPFEEFRILFDEYSKFLIIQAEEVTQESKKGQAIHMGAINIAEEIPAQQGETVAEIIAKVLRAVKESGDRTGRKVFVHVNHPNYKWGVTAEDLAAVVEEPFFEVWNGVDGDNDPGDAFHPSTDEIWDIANTLRISGMNAAPLMGLATDDSHHYLGNKVRAMPGRAWTMVRSPFLTPEYLIQALEAGDFYASTGVELEEVSFDAEKRVYSIRIRGREGETFQTRFIGTRHGVDLRGKPRKDAEGNVLSTTLDYSSETGPQIGEVFHEVSGTEASYCLKGDELYVRAVITSNRAPEVESTELEFQKAWTQPAGWRRWIQAQADSVK